nr:hypothetical protein [Arthrospira sp. PLM2.Bin9]
MNIPPPATGGGSVLIRRIYLSRQAVFSRPLWELLPRDTPKSFPLWGFE